MNFKNSLLSAIIFLSVMQSCNTEPHYKSTMQNLIPKPVSVNATNDFFTLTDATNIYVQSDDAADLQTAQWFADKLKPATGFGLKTSLSKDAPAAGNIYLIHAANDSALGNEGYELAITKDMIKISANKPAGWFYALQTVIQLLPPSIELATKQNASWQIASGVIRDYPEYTYRGFMLDVARHFFSVEEVKHCIDYISMSLVSDKFR